MSNKAKRITNKRRKHLGVLLILLFCYSCTFFIKPAAEKASLRKVESLVDKEDKRLAEILPVIQVENLVKERDWEEVHKAVNEWDFKDSDVEREFKSQVNAVKGFWRALDRCQEQENAFSGSATLGCYKKVIKHNWKHMPKQIYFTRVFASDLNSQKDMILAKIKKMEKVKRRKHQPRKKTTAQEFFNAYYQCFKLEKTAPESLNELISCYREAYTIKENIPRRITYSQKISTDLYTKGREISKRIAHLKTQLAEKKEEKKIKN
jgi:hypothetical protein